MPRCQYADGGDVLLDLLPCQGTQRGAARHALSELPHPVGLEGGHQLRLANQQNLQEFPVVGLEVRQ